MCGVTLKNRISSKELYSRLNVGVNMWNPSNPCMHGPRTLNDDDDDDDADADDVE
jgi:hypothetical protein